MSVLWITEQALSKTEPGDHLVLWSTYTGSESGLVNSFSVPEELDNHFESYRASYLKWLSQLKHQTVNGAALLDNFQIRDGFSMWWMSLLVEKSQWKSQRLYDIFRLLALQKYLQNLERSNIDEVIVNLKDAHLNLVITSWLKDAWKGVGVTNSIEAQPDGVAEKIRKKLSQATRLSLYLLYNLYLTLRLSPGCKSSSSSSQVTIFSYFFNLDKNKLEEGVFNSRYWQPLYQLLHQFDHQYNWFHIFVRDSRLPGQTVAQNNLEKLNQKTDINECHQLLEAQLNVRIFIRSIRDFFRLRKISKQIGEIEHLFSIEQGINFWLLQKQDWHESFEWKTALENCFYLNTFESICAGLEKQHTGLYLLENQAWERALIYAWKKSGHGQVIGIQHASATDGDLRNFQYPDEYFYDSALKLPVPDYIGVNGNASYKQFGDSGFPEQKLIELEALRYLYLKKLIHSQPASPDSDRCRLLVLGDYIASVTEDQMDLLAKSVANMPENVDIFIKSHPACPIDLKKWPSVIASVLEAPLSELSDSYDIAFASNMTAASLDAFFARKPVIIMRDPEKFNMSPLRGNSGVNFVVSPEELAEQVKSCCMAISDWNPDFDEQFFYLDGDLPGYRQLLQSD